MSGTHYTRDQRMDFAALAIRSILEVLQESPGLGVVTQSNVEKWLLDMLCENDATPYRGLVQAAIHRAQGLN